MKFNLWAKVFCFVLFVLEPLYAEEENSDAISEYLLIINANNTYKNEITKSIHEINQVNMALCLCYMFYIMFIIL